MKTINKHLERKAFFAFALLSIFFLMSSCSKSSDPTSNEVLIQGMAYSPATLTVTVGTTVKWTNLDAVTHTVTSDTGLFDSGNISTNGTYSHAFATAGTYNYYCTIHPSMKAKIVVSAASMSNGY